MTQTYEEWCSVQLVSIDGTKYVYQQRYRAIQNQVGNPAKGGLGYCRPIDEHRLVPLLDLLDDKELTKTIKG